MSDRYEYETFPGVTDAVTSVSSELRRIGEEGWEALKLGGGNAIEARRLISGDGPRSWEYHQFDIDLYPTPEGHEHLAGCHWVRINPALRSYDRTSIHVFKRPGWFNGTDDGDIMARLEDHGVSKSDIYGMTWFPASSMSSVHQLFHRILKTKWERSVAAGNDTGTYDAVRQWLADEYIPETMKLLKIEAKPSEMENLLDELLRLREAQRRGLYSFSLRDALKKWAELRGA